MIVSALLNIVEKEIHQMWKKFLKVCERIGYARAAHNLAVMGKYEEAKRLMMKEVS